MDEISTYLGPKGFTILKEYLDIDDLNLIRKELTVKPFVPKTSLASPPSKKGWVLSSLGWISAPSL